MKASSNAHLLTLQREEEIAKDQLGHHIRAGVEVIIADIQKQIKRKDGIIANLTREKIELERIFRDRSAGELDSELGGEGSMAEHWPDLTCERVFKVFARTDVRPRRRVHHTWPQEEGRGGGRCWYREARRPFFRDAQQACRQLET